MSFRWILTASVLATLVIPGNAVRCEVVHGTVTIRPYYVSGFPPPGGWDEAFDFFTRTLVPASSSTWDLALQENDSGGYWLLVIRSSGIAYVSTPIAELEVAPTLGDVGLGDELHFDGTYVLKTVDNLYVKFALLGWANLDYGLNVEYYVQTDGSPSFGPLLAVRSSTWGAVKALYR